MHSHGYQFEFWNRMEKIQRIVDSPRDKAIAFWPWDYGSNRNSALSANSRARLGTVFLSKSPILIILILIEPVHPQSGDLRMQKNVTDPEIIFTIEKEERKVRYYGLPICGFNKNDCSEQFTESQHKQVNDLTSNVSSHWRKTKFYQGFKQQNKRDFSQ